MMWQKWRWAIVGVLVLANLYFWFATGGVSAKNFLTLAVLDVGQGDAIFLEDTAGHQILLDGGPDQNILTALPKVMPFADRSLDLLILSHPHADHVAGLVEVLKRYRVGAVLEAGPIYQSAIYDEWHRLLAEKNIPIILARRGEIIRLAGGSELEVLTPFESWQDKTAKNIHDSMVVTKLMMASSSLALLTGDMEQDLEANLLTTGADLKSVVLKVGHHGSKTSTSENFLRAVAPEFAAISVGAKNKYGHPTPETLNRLAQFKIKTYRTDEAGSIVFHFSPAHPSQPEVTLLR